MFLEELNEPYGENWSKFLTAGYLVFGKQFPAAGFLDTSFHICPLWEVLSLYIGSFPQKFKYHLI